MFMQSLHTLPASIRDLHHNLSQKGNRSPRILNLTNNPWENFPRQMGEFRGLIILEKKYWDILKNAIAIGNRWFNTVDPDDLGHLTHSRYLHLNGLPPMLWKEMV